MPTRAPQQALSVHGPPAPTALREAGRFCALAVLVLSYALATAGCANCRLRLDPTGEHIFAPADAPPPGALPTPGASASPTLTPIAARAPLASGANVAPALPPGAVGALGEPVPVAPLAGRQPGLTLSPVQIVAPVGSEVVLVAGVMGGQGYLLSRERVEWMLSAGEPGHFVALGDNGLLDCLNRIHGLPRKVDNSYAINTTLTRPRTISRGTPSPYDDLSIHSGQAWVTVSSPNEGTSHVSAFAPGVAAWDRRQASSTIYWVDAQWSFPPPAINPVGSRHTFTTTLTRQSDRSPLAGWVVRYEIQGGTEAGFSPDGSPAGEVTTNELGQASVEIFQKQPAPGTNQIAIQVVRPASLGSGRRLVLGTGSVLNTWTSSQLAVRTRGPELAGVGSIATYRIEVSNAGGVPARDVVLTDLAPPGLVFVNSNPAANPSPSAQEWRLGEVGAGQTSVVEANYRVQQAGTFQYCATATSSDGISARDCVTTVTAAGQVSLRITGPDTAEVGSQAQFELEVLNQSDAPAAGLLITDRFDVGLEHAASASPIERDLPEIAPGGSQKVAVTFRVTRAGQLCQEAVVSGAGVNVTARKCLTATAPLNPVPAPPAGPGAATPPSAPPRAVPSEPAGSPNLSVRKTGPAQRRVGELAEFNIEVTNTGTAPLLNVRVADNYDTTLEPTAATNGWQLSGGAIVWNYPSLEPGQPVRLQVNCQCNQEATRACNRVTVTADGGVSQAAEACLEIVSNADNPPAANTAPQPVPVPATAPGNLSLSVTDDVDPARVGGEVIYQILLTNKSPDSDRQVLVTAQLPDGVTLKGIKLSGPDRAKISQRTLRFPPIAELRAGESIAFEVRIRVDQPGSIRFTTDATSLRQPDPVTAETTTEVLPQG